MNTMGERIRLARENKKISQQELSDLIGVKASSGVISNWERDLNKPDAEKIVKLCEALNVSLSYLLDYYGKTDFQLSLNEEEHIKKYRSLDNHGKKNVINILDNEYDRCNTVEEETTPYLVQPYYTIGASAGNGEYLFEDLEQSEILLPDTVLNRRSDFIIDVKGSSMEPTYYNGDKLLVTKLDELNIGDIGIFIINGESFVKELGNGELISHNQSYQNIKLNEFDNIKTIGKVIGKLN